MAVRLGASLKLEDSGDEAWWGCLHEQITANEEKRGAEKEQMQEEALMRTTHPKLLVVGAGGRGWVAFQALSPIPWKGLAWLHFPPWPARGTTAFVRLVVLGLPLPHQLSVHSCFSQPKEGNNSRRTQKLVTGAGLQATIT